jgi:hypothetical protein
MKPTAPYPKCVQCVCHHTLPWLISVSLGLMRFSERSRFSLTIESGLISIVLFFGIVGSLWKAPLGMVGMIVILPLSIHMRRVTNHLNTRKEPFTSQQKRVIFGLGVSYITFLVLIFFVVAVHTRAPLAWIAFALASLVAAACTYASYRQLYVDQT